MQCFVLFMKNTKIHPEPPLVPGLFQKWQTDMPVVGCIVCEPKSDMIMTVWGTQLSLSETMHWV
jgi:hypothetical protein